MICPRCNGIECPLQSLMKHKVPCYYCFGTGRVSSYIPVFVGDSTNDNVGWEGQPSES